MENGEEGNDEKEKVKSEGGGRPKILADGTYATETAFSSGNAAKLEAVRAAAKPPLRSTCSFTVVSISLIQSLNRSTSFGWRLLHRGCFGQRPY